MHGVLREPKEIRKKIGGYLEPRDLMVVRHALFEEPIPRSAELLNWAVEFRTLELVKYLVDQGCPWDAYTCDWAALNKTPVGFEILQWLHEQDCPWDEWTCYLAAGNEAPHSFEMLKWLYEQDCPWDDWTCRAAAANPALHSFEMLKWLYE